MLARRDCHCIRTRRWDEYPKYIEKAPLWKPVSSRCWSIRRVLKERFDSAALRSATSFTTGQVAGRRVDSPGVCSDKYRRPVSADQGDDLIDEAAARCDEIDSSRSNWRNRASRMMQFGDGDSPLAQRQDPAFPSGSRVAGGGGGRMKAAGRELRPRRTKRSPSPCAYCESLDWPSSARRAEREYKLRRAPNCARNHPRIEQKFRSRGAIKASATTDAQGGGWTRRISPKSSADGPISR